MRKYETLLLFSPELGSDDLKKLVEDLTGIVEREKGKLLDIDDWGMRDLAYPVKKQTRGHYVRLEYGAPAAAIAELERIIRITDGIFKFVTVQLEEKLEGGE